MRRVSLDVRNSCAGRVDLGEVMRWVDHAGVHHLNRRSQFDRPRRAERVAHVSFQTAHRRIRAEHARQRPRLGRIALLGTGGVRADVAMSDGFNFASSRVAFMQVIIDDSSD